MAPPSSGIQLSYFTKSGSLDTRDYPDRSVEVGVPGGDEITVMIRYRSDAIDKGTDMGLLLRFNGTDLAKVKGMLTQLQVDNPDIKFDHWKMVPKGWKTSRMVPL